MKTVAHEFPRRFRDRRRTKRAAMIAQVFSSESLTQSLDELRESDNYYQWISSLMANVLSGRVLEVGAGSGTFTKWIDRQAESVDALEPSPEGFRQLGETVNTLNSVRPINDTLANTSGAIDGPYDNAVLVNVLEHIAEDLECLKLLADFVRPGGRIAVWVPAHEILYAPFDREVGHFRRYSRSELTHLALQAGLEVEEVKYKNAAGAIAWAVVATLARRRPTSGRLALLWDRHFIPRVARLEKGVTMPFGQSLILIARVPRTL